MELNIDFLIDKISDFIKEKFVNDMIVEFQTYHNTKLTNNYEYDTPDLSIDLWVDAKIVNDEYAEITNVSFGYIDYMYRFNVPNFQDRMNWIEDEVNNNLIGYKQNI